jgi:hypothetical protein
MAAWFTSHYDCWQRSICMGGAPLGSAISFAFALPFTPYTSNMQQYLAHVAEAEGEASHTECSSRMFGMSTDVD